MLHSRLLVPVVSLVTALVIGPTFAGVAMAADPVVVQPGDTLTGIANRHGVPIPRIIELNDLADPNRIYVGQRLRLREDGGSVARPSRASGTPSGGSAGRSHTVRLGETLTHIAARHGVTIAAIVAANGIANPSRIYAGQRLTIPGTSGSGSTRQPSSPSPAPASQPGGSRSHTVRLGETLTHIAARHGVTIAAIVAANGIANPSRIYAGQRLTIPGTSGSGASPAPSVPASMAALMERREQVRRVIVAEAGRYDVPASLALAVAWQESGWQQGVVSRAGAIGVMQILPATGQWVGEAMLGRPVDLTKLRQNVRAGVRLLAHYLDRYDGNLDLVLAAYYQGQTAADRHGVYAVSRPYIASIKALVRIFGG